jgi:hypothetical protein
LPPIFHRLHLPIHLRSAYNQFGEDNDGCGNAFPIPVNSAEQFLAEDQDDWYRAILSPGGSLTVSLTNFVPQAGQLAVFRGATCGTAEFLGSVGNPGPTKIVALGDQPAGTYFIYVSNDGPLNEADLYTLLVQVQ